MGETGQVSLEYMTKAYGQAEDGRIKLLSENQSLRKELTELHRILKVRDWTISKADYILKQFDRREMGVMYTKDEKNFIDALRMNKVFDEVRGGTNAI